MPCSALMAHTGRGPMMPGMTFPTAIEVPPKRRRLSRLAAAARRLADPGGLHRCPACGEAFVCPMEWETDGEHHWRMQLRCAACDTWRDVRASNEEARHHSSDSGL